MPLFSVASHATVMNIQCMSSSSIQQYLPPISLCLIGTNKLRGGAWFREWRFLFALETVSTCAIAEAEGGGGWGLVGVGVLFRFPVLFLKFFVGLAVRLRPTCVTVTLSFHHNCINGPLCFTGPIFYFFSALGYSSKGIQRQNRVTQQSGRAASDPGGFSGRSTPDQTESSSWVYAYM